MELLQNRVKEFRTALNISQMDFAMACETSRENISRIECGSNRNLSYLLAYSISYHLNQPIETVFPVLK